MIIIEEDYLNEGFIDNVKDKANKFIDRSAEYGKVFLRPVQSAANAVGAVGSLAGAVGGTTGLINLAVKNPILGAVSSKLTTIGTATLPFALAGGAVRWIRDAFDDGRVSLKELMIRRKLNAEEDARMAAIKAKTAQQDARDQAIRTYARQLVNNPSTNGNQVN